MKPKGGTDVHMTLRFVEKMIVLSMIVAGSAAPACAQVSDDWDLSGFKPQTFEMGVATNKKTGHKMHVIRLKDGTVMAMVPAVPLWDVMKDRALG